MNLPLLDKLRDYTQITSPSIFSSLKKTVLISENTYSNTNISAVDNISKSIYWSGISMTLYRGADL